MSTKTTMVQPRTKAQAMTMLTRAPKVMVGAVVGWGWGLGGGVGSCWWRVAIAAGSC